MVFSFSMTLLHPFFPALKIKLIWHILLSSYVPVPVVLLRFMILFSWMLFSFFMIFSPHFIKLIWVEWGRVEFLRAGHWSRRYKNHIWTHITFTISFNLMLRMKRRRVEFFWSRHWSRRYDYFNRVNIKLIFLRFLFNLKWSRVKFFRPRHWSRRWRNHFVNFRNNINNLYFNWLRNRWPVIKGNILTLGRKIFGDIIFLNFFNRSGEYKICNLLRRTKC